jgi:hypothetical protein
MKLTFIHPLRHALCLDSERRIVQPAGMPVVGQIYAMYAIPVLQCASERTQITPHAKQTVQQHNIRAITHNAVMQIYGHKRCLLSQILLPCVAL